MFQISETERFAFHEAGHAIVARVYSLDVERVTIYRPSAAGGGNNLIDLTGASREAKISTILAGPVAEYKVTGKTSTGWFNDEADLYPLAGPLAVEAKWIPHVTQLLSAHWPAVEALAAALVERGKLSGDEVREIFR